jgi:hypothetical protein
MQCEPVTGRNSPAMTRTTAARVGASPLRGPQQLVSRRLAVLAAAVLLLTTPTGTIIPTVRAALTNFTFVDRHYYPAGYKDGTTSGIPDLCVPFHSFMFRSHSLSVCACVRLCCVCVCRSCSITAFRLAPLCFMELVWFLFFCALLLLL